MKKTPSRTEEAAPYSALAEGYDFVMRHVDYEGWAAYAHHLLEKHHPGARDLLELGCGTGRLAWHLQPLGPYRYTATDGSAAMIRRARAHAPDAIRFEVADFTDFSAAAPVDAAVLLYDGLNYLLEEETVAALFGCVARALRPGGVFLFDQSTPANSLGNADYFGDEGEKNGFAFVRRSAYDAEARLHTTTFEVTRGGRITRERHVQRAYTPHEIRAVLDASPLQAVAAYDGFSENPALEGSERVHWIARRRPG